MPFVSSSVRTISDRCFQEVWTRRYTRNRYQPTLGQEAVHRNKTEGRGGDDYFTDHIIDCVYIGQFVRWKEERGRRMRAIGYIRRSQGWYRREKGEEGG